jgi:hypothetical protein
MMVEVLPAASFERMVLFTGVRIAMVWISCYSEKSALIPLKSSAQCQWQWAHIFYAAVRDLDVGHPRAPRALLFA